MCARLKYRQKGNAMEAMQNCGHVAIPSTSWLGFGTDALGYTWCANCVGPMEAAAMAFSDTYTVYMSERTVTTWTGYALGRLQAVSYGRRKRWSRNGPWRMRSVRVVTPDGRTWWGRGSDQYDVITLHATTNSRKG